MTDFKDYEIKGRISEYYLSWFDKVPYVDFDSDMQARAVPPFGGALVRYSVKKGEARVSVYLDADNSLGCWEGPYWEIYPYDDDTMRYDIEDTKGLVEGIRHSLKQQQGS